ncbi:hypothetical protein E2P81_ATG07529 [Venturia nashicola]|uniref:Uncharacterized protein n=1 Tax=Venturia nashicola TaxID=86259 RepID=A0A4Z1NYH0_9PEZI|nr:hypothetical protein E6O75_ATG07689 [Venturia nashicola]TLD32039.1 hypothetical protein E2P81_ATG07529 [Venturia nashicola]
MASTKPSPLKAIKAKAITKPKSTSKANPKPKTPSQKTTTQRKARVSKTKASKSRRFKSNSFWGLPTEIRQLILSYTYTDRDMEKSILRRWGEARFVFGPYFFDTDDLRDRTLLLMDVDPKVKREMEFVRKKWLSRGRELANAKAKVEG